MQTDPSNPASRPSFRGLLSSPEADAALAKQRPATALEVRLQLSRNLNPGRHGLPYRVRGARRELGRILRILDPKGDAAASDARIADLRKRRENLAYLEQLLSCVSETPARKSPLEFYASGPRHHSRESWLLQSRGEWCGEDAQPVTWDGFPYYRYTPWRNPVDVPHVYNVIDSDHCAACDAAGFAGEHDWDPAFWFREVFRTETGWVVEDSLRCCVCGVVVESRAPKTFEGEVHPFLRR
jgi:hypothetical protein